MFTGSVQLLRTPLLQGSLDEWQVVSTGLRALFALQAMDGTTKRLKIADVVTNMFRSVLALSPGAHIIQQAGLLQRIRAVVHAKPLTHRLTDVIGE